MEVILGQCSDSRGSRKSIMRYAGDLEVRCYFVAEEDILKKTKWNYCEQITASWSGRTKKCEENESSLLGKIKFRGAVWEIHFLWKHCHHSHHIIPWQVSMIILLPCLLVEGNLSVSCRFIPLTANFMKWDRSPSHLVGIYIRVDPYRNRQFKARFLRWKLMRRGGDASAHYEKGSILVWYFWHWNTIALVTHLNMTRGNEDFTFRI